LKVENLHVKQLKEQMKKKLKEHSAQIQDVILVGPFIGELLWELYYFVPYIIYLKKQTPDKKLIVFTRPSRFDLYGSYVDIFLPLILENDECKNQKCFSISNFDNNNYTRLVEYFKDRYRKNYKIESHIYPRISNIHFVDSFIKDNYKKKKSVFIVGPKIKIPSKYNSIYFNDLLNDINEKDSSYTIIGCLIEIIKKCDFVISNFDHIVTKIALLLCVKVFLTDEKIIDADTINLYNPLRTEIHHITEGVK